MQDNNSDICLSSIKSDQKYFDYLYFKILIPIMKTSFLKAVTLLFLLNVLGESGKSQVKLPPFFKNKMVLQKGIKIPVWGWASPGEKVTVSLDKNSVTTRTGKDGKWKISLPEMNYGGPYKMTVKGKNLLVFENILIGDVWLCSGQSNMGFRVVEGKNAKAEITAANYPSIRLFTVKRKMAKVPLIEMEEANWQECSPETVGDFSAVGYFFGRNLYEHLKVPVGLINSSWGGTNVETWTSPEMTAKDPELVVKLDKLKSVDLNGATGINGAIIGPNNYPTLLYNGMINPLVPFGIKGVIWYQGEANAGNAQQYKQRFPNMITDWRTKWNQGNFPFLFVQLANYMNPVNEPSEATWAELREAQTQTLGLDNTGMATTIDIGDSANIHPTDKQTVGYRLSLSARKVAYGEDIVYSGPAYHEMRIEGNRVYITFDQVGSGLKAKDKYGYLKGFTVAGQDHKFKWAMGIVTDKNTVMVICRTIENPVAVRYAWANNPDDVNLYNQEGLPAIPFRTDSWKGITK
jgi:sialate O-acetylesterase